MKKTFFFLTLMLSASIFAAEPTHLRVHYTDGTSTKHALDERLVMRFLQDNLSLITQEQNASIALNDIRKMNFLDADTPDTPTGMEQSIANNASTRKVLENGQVIIIKDGIRYNLLGIRIR